MEANGVGTPASRRQCLLATQLYPGAPPAGHLEEDRSRVRQSVQRSEEPGLQDSRQGMTREGFDMDLWGHFHMPA